MPCLFSHVYGCVLSLDCSFGSSFALMPLCLSFFVSLLRYSNASHSIGDFILVVGDLAPIFSAEAA